MALISKIVEKYQYLTQYCVRVNILDDATGRIYHSEYAFASDPTSIVIDTQIASTKLLIQQEIDFENNDMNLTIDEEKAIEYLRNIKNDTVKQIRANPTATKQQAINYINAKYANSLVNVEKLLTWYANFLNLATWDEFKTFVINHKFEGID